jgi:hypothetical protein
MGVRGMSTLRSIARALAGLVLASGCLSLTTCGTALLDLVAFQVLADEEAMLYMGCETDGYGIARIGLSTGALEILRRTVSPDNTSGCPVAIDPVPITEAVPYTKLYFAVESPNQVMQMDYRAMDPAVKIFATDQTTATDCIRVTANAEAIYWSTRTSIHRGTLLDGGAAPLPLPISVVTSFDVDAATGRIYYLGLRTASYLEDFSVWGVNAGGSGEVQISKIGRYVISNLLFLDGDLYYVTQNPHGLWRIKANGSEPTPTLLLTPVGQPWAIAVDPVDRTLYWVEGDANVNWRVMRAAAGASAGTPVREYIDEVDPNGFFFYRPAYHP